MLRTVTCFPPALPGSPPSRASEMPGQTPQRDSPGAWGFLSSCSEGAEERGLTDNDTGLCNSQDPRDNPASP